MSPAAWLRAGVAAGLLLGCAPTLADAYVHAFAAGERAYHAGRYREAAAAFDDAAVKAERVKDRDEARLMQARSFERAGAWDEARASYERLAADSPSGPRTARAAFELAEIAIEHGDAERGWAMLLEATRRYPRHGLARAAVRRMAEHEEEGGGAAAAVAWLRRQAPSFRGTELDEVFGYQTALALERSGDREGALRGLVATARAHPYPQGSLTDDAYVRAARLAVELGRPAEGIGYLREMLAPREGAATGSYERPRFSEGQMEIGKIYRDAIGDRAAARREFHKLYADHRSSILRDDALWAEARLWHQDGMQKEACATASLLAREFPESRYAPCVRALCPSLPAPKRACADYVLRELAPGGDDAPGDDAAGGGAGDG